MKDQNPLPKILVVDDTPDNVALLEFILQGEGWNVIKSFDSASCISSAIAENPDIILLDIMMPKIDGIETCIKLKKDVRTQDIPVIFISALDSQEKIIEGLDAGGHDYVTKPICEPILLARMRSALRDRLAFQEVEELAARLEEANLRLIEKRRALSQANDQLQLMALEDTLMKIGNRRAMHQDLLRVHTQSLRYHNEYSLCLLDIDHFKKYNDHYGHMVADQILEQIGSLLKENIRATDSVYRYGGEEILVLCPNTDCEGALVIAERIRDSVVALGIEHELSEHKQVTLSGGIARFNPNDPGVNFSAIIELADQALYQAKEAGRNQISIYQEPGD